MGSTVTVRTAVLDWSNTQPKLSQRQVRWSLTKEHNATLQCMLGRMNVLALSRKPDLQVDTAMAEIMGRAPTRQLVEADWLVSSEQPLRPCRQGTQSMLRAKGSSPSCRR